MVWWRRRGVLTSLTVAYGLVLLVLVTGSWGWELNRLTVACYVQFRYDWPIAPDWVGPEHYGVLLNVVLFVPLGALTVLATGLPWWVVAAGATLGSVAVELVQWRWLTRDGSSSDVIANALGAFVGALAVTLRGRIR